MDNHKREHLRSRVPRVVVRIPSVERLRTLYLRDLSLGGLFVRTEKVLALNAQLDVEIEPPGWDQPIALAGRVVRVDNDEAAQKRNAVGMAIRFEESTTEANQRLAQLIAEHGEPLDPDVARLGAQVQNVTAELETARTATHALRRELADKDARERLATQRSESHQLELEALRTRVRELEGDEAARPAVDASSASALRALQQDLGEAQVEIAKLTARLAEAQTAARTAQSDLKSLEEDEAATRALLERTAHDKATLEQRLADEQQRSAVELERVRRESSQSDDRRLLEQARSRLGELERMLGAESELRAKSEVRAEAMRAALDEARASGEVVNAEQRAVSLQLSLERDRALNLQQKLAEAADQLAKSRAREKEVRRLLSAMSPSSQAEVVVVEEAALADAPENPTEEFEIDVETDGGVAEQRSADFNGFQRRLEAGERLLRTTELARHKPADALEGQIMGWLDTCDNISALRALARGNISDARLANVLFQLYCRGAIEFGFADA